MKNIVTLLPPPFQKLRRTTADTYTKSMAQNSHYRLPISENRLYAFILLFSLLICAISGTNDTIPVAFTEETDVFKWTENVKDSQKNENRETKSPEAVEKLTQGKKERS
jgi:hypothetical protein